MKKLKFLILALIGCIGISSCTNELSYPKQDKVQLVKNPDFIAWSGQEIFGNTFTYSTVKPDGGNQDAPYNNSDNVQCKPNNVTDEERDYVVKYFHEHQGKSDAVEKDFKNFYVQQVSYDDGPFIDGNGSEYTGKDCVVEIEVRANGNKLDNIFGGNDDFNKCRYIYDSSSLDFWYNNSKCSYWSNNFKMVYIPGYGYYVGFDVEGYPDDEQVANKNMHIKNNPDGWYYDRIIKIVPANENAYPLYPGDEGFPGIESTNTSSIVDKHNNEVEVNLELVDSHTQHGIVDLASKLSIHVRHATNVTINIPIPANYIIESDDLYIFDKHYVNGVYGTESIQYEIAGQTVTLNVDITDEGLQITTEGINEQVIEYCQEHYKDGINFEVWTYYQGDGRESILESLNESTITFTNNPRYYINAFGYDWNELDKLDGVNPDDCYVRPSENYGEPNRTEHLNGTPYNDIYTLLN